VVFDSEQLILAHCREIAQHSVARQARVISSNYNLEITPGRSHIIHQGTATGLSDITGNPFPLWQASFNPIHADRKPLSEGFWPAFQANSGQDFTWCM